VRGKVHVCAELNNNRPSLTWLSSRLDAILVLYPAHELVHLVRLVLSDSLTDEDYEILGSGELAVVCWNDVQYRRLAVLVREHLI
jgi:hypothetical protein